VTQAIKRIRASAPHVAVSVAALNTATGRSYSYGKRSNMWTASVYKLFILEVLLHARNGALSSYEMANAARAIENSDNVAGYNLFLDAGGNAGLASGFAALGLKHTVPGASDPTFTRTSAQDCLTLLRHLVQKGPLDRHSRNYALGLMQNVEADQRWGVGVVADRGDDFANKNGWLSLDDSNGPGETDNGLWVVNSVGVMRVHGQLLLMAVLSEHNSDMGSGVHLIQRIAKSAVKAVVAQG
jgi:beta-lactamase class A